MSLNLDKSAWKSFAFGDVVRNVNVTVRDPSAARVDRFIAMEHMDPGELNIKRWGRVSDGTTFTRRVRPGQTLFGKRRAYQRKVAFADFEAICSGDIYTFEADGTQILEEFLPFLVQSDDFFDFALDTSAGSLSPRTNWRDLSSFAIDLPPIDVQRRVADLLWSIESAIQATSKVVDQVGSLATATFQSAATSERVGQLSQWVERIEAGRSPKAAADPALNDELGVLKVSAVGRDVFVPSENKRLLDPAEFRVSDIVRAGDVLVTRANAVVDNVARPCIVDRDFPNLMLSDKTLRIVPVAGFPRRMILAALSAPEYRSYVREVVNGTEAKNISQAKILGGPVPTMSELEVRRMDRALSALDSAAAAAQLEVARLLSLKASILTEVFGGK